MSREFDTTWQVSSREADDSSFGRGSFTDWAQTARIDLRTGESPLENSHCEYLRRSTLSAEFCFPVQDQNQGRGWDFRRDSNDKALTIWGGVERFTERDDSNGEECSRILDLKLVLLGADRNSIQNAVRSEVVKFLAVRPPDWRIRGPLLRHLPAAFAAWERGDIEFFPP